MILSDEGGEAGGYNMLKEFAEGDEEADGAVGYGVGGWFIGFLDRVDFGHFPRDKKCY